MYRLTTLSFWAFVALGCSTTPDRCGTRDLRCCSESPACGASLVCTGGICMANDCGGEGQPCCGSTSCNFASLQCRDSLCRAAVVDGSTGDTSVDATSADAVSADAISDSSDASSPRCATATNCGACVDPTVVRDCHWCNATGLCVSTTSTCEFGLRRSASECSATCDPTNTPCIGADDCCGDNVCGFGVCRAANTCARDASPCSSLGSAQGCQVCQVSGVNNGSSSLIYCVPQASTCASSPQCCGFMRCVGGRCACRSPNEPCMNDDDCCGPHRAGRCVGATRTQTGVCSNA